MAPSYHPKFTRFIAICCFALALLQSPRSSAGPWILFDADTGKLVAQNQATRPWHPASLTKLMTAYTVFREVEAGRISFSSPVAVTAKAYLMPPSKIGLPVGTILRVDTAIRIIMVKSANDIALALGQAAKGSLRAFVAAMNENARRLGMNATHFSNPHGLHAPDQVSTARDMGLLALALQNEFPQYSDFFNIPAITLGKTRMRNHNGLIFGFAGTNGFKTGYTCPSGLNIVARAKRGGRQMIVVVLGGYSSVQRNALAAQLLGLGFNDRFYAKERPHIRDLIATARQYNVPENLTPMICKPNWRERKQTKKQRRETRKLHLAKLKQLRDKYLGDKVKTGPAQKVTLGSAFGPNPFNLKVENGATPPPYIATPIWRPDRSTPPV